MLEARKKNVFGFAGGGGSSEAAALAGLSVDAALNHWDTAIAVHEANHPICEHFLGDIFDTPPGEVLPGEEIGLAWFSPDCRHFSKAKGGTPVSKRVRGLAWVVILWAKLRRPDVIMMENVEEWLTWGPLVQLADETWAPDPARKGQTAALFFQRLRQCGYEVEHRVTSAADFGDPTLRKRLLVIARRDGRPIVWPEPVFAPRGVAAARGLRPHRAAAEIIDFSRPCHSIFLDKAAARAVGVKRPLEEATLRRIARGLFRYTISSADPFIVPVTHAGDDRAHSVRDSLRTMTTSPRGEFALVAPVLATENTESTDGAAADHVRDFRVFRGEQTLAPHLVRTDQSSSAGRAGVRSAQDPAATITGAGGLAAVSAYLVPHFGERAGQEPRSRSVEAPYPTVVPGGRTGDLVTASIIKMSENSTFTDMREPLHTAMAGAPRHGVVAAFMEQANTGMTGHDAREPVSTIVQRGTTQRLISAQLTQFRGWSDDGQDVRVAAPTITADGKHEALLTALLDADIDLAKPFGPHGDELRAFLVKYYGSATAEDLADPLATTTSRSRFGLVVVRGALYRIVDIGMRMLDPETELAAAMGFRRDYRWVGADGRKITKTNITKLVGNAVCRHWAAAHIAANCAHLIYPPAAAALEAA